MASLDDDNEVIYTGRKFRLERAYVAAAAGGRLQREILVHPGAAVILPVTEAGEIVLIRNMRYAADRRLWELPAGTLEPPELPIDCAARELIEETGYRADRLSLLGGYYSSPGFCTEYMHLFLAEGLEFVGQCTEPGEDIEVCPVELDRAKAMMLSGEIIDAKTLAGLGLYFLGRGQSDPSRRGGA